MLSCTILLHAFTSYTRTSTLLYMYSPDALPLAFDACSGYEIASFPARPAWSLGAKAAHVLFSSDASFPDWLAPTSEAPGPGADILHIYTILHVCVCACVCVRARACVCVFINIMSVCVCVYDMNMYINMYIPGHIYINMCIPGQQRTTQSSARSR